MAGDDAGPIEEWDAAVADGAPVDQDRVRRKERLQVLGVMRRLAVQHRLARRPGEPHGEVVAQRPPSPERQRAEELAVRRELGDERVLHVERGGQLPHEGREELIADLGLDTLDDRTERSIIGVRFPALCFARHVSWPGVPPASESGGHNIARTGRRE